MKELLEQLFMKRNKPPENPSEHRSQADRIEIPGYLVYPSDPLSQIMFGSKMQKVCDKRCGYQFMLYTDIADLTPEIRQQRPPFDINETHIF